MKLENKYIRRLLAVMVAALLSLHLMAGQEPTWSESAFGLPYCRYDSSSDARHLLGNYRMNLVTHADGVYEIISGERVWARFNADSLRPDYGRNRATVIHGKKRIELVGSASNSSKYRREVYSGIGFTRYEYKLDGGLKCSRMISVMPSDEVNGGRPCFVISVTFSNTGRGSVNFGYEEAFSPEFVPVSDQMVPYSDRSFRYPIYTEIHFRCLKARFLAEARRFIPVDFPEARSEHEMDAQEIFLYSDNAFLSINEGEFKALYSDVRLRSGEKVTFNIVIGFSDGSDDKAAAEQVMSQVQDGQFGAFEAMWKKKLPDFSDERNRIVRREMYLNAYALESTAVYNDFFKETFVPAEASDAFHSGKNLSNRDHLQIALSACYTNPELAKSTMKYVMKHADYSGHIHDGNYGFGCVVPSEDSCRDLNVMLFHTVAEYLRITGDYEFLDEWLALYPMSKAETTKVIHVLEKCFVYLRDVIEKESDLIENQHNHALVSSFFPSFIEQLKSSGKASGQFTEALEEYADMAWASFRKSDDSLYDHIEESKVSNVKSMALYDYFRALE